MADEIATGASEAVDPAAVSLALAGASRVEADAYLRDQRHHLHEQLKQIHLDIWGPKNPNWHASPPTLFERRPPWPWN